MFWFQLVVAVALLAAVGWLAVGGGGHMSEPVQDRPDLALPSGSLLERTDVDQVRFSVGVRGYRMDEVDDVLDRLAAEIDLRERRIAELEGRPYPADGDDQAESAAGSAADPQAETGPAPEGAAAEQGAGAAHEDDSDGDDAGDTGETAEQ